MATMTTVDGDTARLLREFTRRVRAAVPLAAVWVHGSLVTDDYRPGRSDLDLVAVLDQEESADIRQRGRLAAVHRLLTEDRRAAAKLHCSYLSRGTLRDAAADHFTFAQGEAFARPVTPVARRELLDGGHALHGPRPAALLPPLEDGEPAAFIRADLRDYWYAMAARGELWTQDVWVAFGLLTPARAAVALHEDRMITKREALAVAAGMGAPVRALEDVRALRYDARPVPASEPWRTERAGLVRAFVRSTVRDLLGDDLGTHAGGRGGTV